MHPVTFKATELGPPGPPYPQLLMVLTCERHIVNSTVSEHTGQGKLLTDTKRREASWLQQRHSPVCQQMETEVPYLLLDIHTYA